MSALWLLVRRSLRQHLLSTTITAAAMALACGLVMAVFAVQRQAQEAFAGEVGFDAVLGARGSQLQLVLNTVFHLETSPGNIPWTLYKAIRDRGDVELAIPYAVGDNYRGFRIVGTSTELFDKFEYREGERFRIASGGALFDPDYREAVIGSYVAERTGLGIGATFNPYHGVDDSIRHPQIYTVVGILEPTNSPSDRVIWIPIEGVWRLEGHVLGNDYEAQADKPIPDEHKEVSAVMVKFNSRIAGYRLQQDVNHRGKEATLAWPIAGIVKGFLDRFAWLTEILLLVAYLVVLVAVGSILASIYNTMNERRREFAILRALGARRGTVFSAIVTEAAVIAGLGAALGYFVYAAILGAAAAVLRAQTGVVLDVFAGHPVLWAAPLGMILLGALAGVLPAVKAYSTDVAENLLPQS